MASEACYDIAKAYGVPFISGKDSLNNEYSTGKKTIAIPPTLLISCISIMDDVTKAITMDAKEPGNKIYLVGLTHDELGGSQYYKLKGFVGNSVPKVDPVYGKRLMGALARAISSRCVRSCHDCSDGGMAVALAEMAFAGGLGMKIDLCAAKAPDGQKHLRDDALLFSESNTRFIVEVRDENNFIRAMKGLPIWRLGEVVARGTFKIIAPDGSKIVDTEIGRLKEAWQSAFKEL